jgi:hypothetical protein
MTNFQAFCRGFWSARDFTRSLSERQSIRPHSEMFDIQRAQEQLSLNEGYWESVGNYQKVP